jgi:hypothetical protein
MNVCEYLALVRDMVVLRSPAGRIGVVVVSVERHVLRARRSDVNDPRFVRLSELLNQMRLGLIEHCERAIVSKGFELMTLGRSFEVHSHPTNGGVEADVARY